ncbi:methylenetetrahydrofolate--tRNA-(uracil(54)-C(5))-methyltransferase (FADH(2)-oxidizing) TrmFO [Candidatus Xianfuyuplasma coldseepsis]|uniref:Methylenetetrahydrofolate--tRNA-(uracil-5-)-methyltransferase TrmFO n=1 Tax=Candidatus Xianfuyuplasma coldseepsis TaxID=2782163 RepID=A0A7L7KPT9_9MOLU|nr:methylenetetrahydrofolate--tRNA-(uracil(54)-C(5))-methyltransferase (FADH(2)-oxidizing) TrmFO [Xianfuyuplasma coldseepsis]QMS84733.1 methylenetetrahydrofolate--tRNA-(uracil(54)-C(5))-methyltransferase (FADH(2)-oxidizing) TrmFO [Xianfuyuplasma coldseepsis]
MKQTVTVIGAGLAGSEASYQLAKRGFNVHLYEMRPTTLTPAHKTGDFAELVCSNSMRSNSLENAVGLLKEEMRMLDSIIIRTADESQVPAGGALAVDRDIFSQKITNQIRQHPNITVIEEELKTIPDGPVIIATGPLTSDALSRAIKALIHEDYLYFFDAAAPIIEFESIDMSKAYKKSRYDKGEAAYINCPMTKDEFDAWYDELITANAVTLKDFELKVFEGCMPFEEMARRGRQTLLFGPMKPVGLEQPDGTRPYAVVQLRQDNMAGTLYNIVGFQTHLTFGEQKRIIRMIPGLENASIVRYGVMHRNTFINSPKLLTRNYQLRDNPNMYFAGQITGVEGYVESAGSGLLAGIALARQLDGKPEIIFPEQTIIGSESYYISHASISSFQPMNANFGILAPLDFKHKKKERKTLYKERSLEIMNNLIRQLEE